MEHARTPVPAAEPTLGACIALRADPQDAGSASGAGRAAPKSACPPDAAGLPDVAGGIAAVACRPDDRPELHRADASGSTRVEKGPPARPAGGTRRPRPVVLRGRHLALTYGDGATRASVLVDASLDLRRGELVLLMGPSGSGKSTLLAVLSGLLRPTAGKVFALGEDLWATSDGECERFRRRHCSYVFQGYNLFPALTAREQLEIVLKWGESATAREARERADQTLATLGLADKADLRPGQLSGGEKQRVAIARALVKRPTLCFADEPTAALDWANGRRVIELLRAAAHDGGAAVLVVAHDPRIAAYADRVVCLRNGRLRRAKGVRSAQPGGRILGRPSGRSDNQGAAAADPNTGPASG